MNRPYMPYKNKHGVIGRYLIDQGLLRAVPDQIFLGRRLEDFLPDADGFIYPLGGMMATSPSSFGQGPTEICIHVQAGVTQQTVPTVKMPPNQQAHIATLSHRGMSYKLNWGRDDDRLKVVMQEDLLLTYLSNSLPPERAVLGMLQAEIPEFRFLSMKNPHLAPVSPGLVMFIAEITEWAVQKQSSMAALISDPSSADMSGLYSIAQHAPKPKKKHDCHCDLYLIMREGCKCGGG